MCEISPVILVTREIFQKPYEYGRFAKQIIIDIVNDVNKLKVMEH